MYIGYIDKYEFNISTDEQKKIISEYADIHKIKLDAIFENQSIKSILKTIKTDNNVFLMANTLALGNKLTLVRDNLDLILSNKNEVIIVSDNHHFNTSSIVSALSDVIAIRNEVVSVLTKNKLIAKKRIGQKLGRDYGSKNLTSAKFDRKTDLLNDFKSGLPKSELMKKYGISRYLVNQILNGTENLEEDHA